MRLAPFGKSAAPRTTQPHQGKFAISQKLAERSNRAADVCDAATERKVMPYLLELLDGTLVNTTALVDQVCIPV